MKNHRKSQPGTPEYFAMPYIPAKDPMTAIAPSRHPFQIWTMVAVVLGGAGNLFDSKSAINVLLPHYIVVIWALCLLFSGSFALYGAFARDRIWGLLVERVGMSTLGFSAIAYGSGIVFIAGAAAVFSGALTVSVGVASFWRLIHINRELKILQQFIARTHLARE